MEACAGSFEQISFALKAGNAPISCEGILAMAIKCDRIVTINLDGCKAINNEALAALGSHQHQSLSAISLRRCPLIDSVGIEALMAGCKVLEKIDVSWCRKIDSAACARALQGCRLHIAAIPLFEAPQKSSGCRLTLACSLYSLTASKPSALFSEDVE